MSDLVVLKNQTIKLDSGDVHIYNNVTINSGGILTSNYSQIRYCIGGSLLLYITNNLIIKNGGCIDMSCKGYNGGFPGSNGNGPNKGKIPKMRNEAFKSQNACGMNDIEWRRNIKLEQPLQIYNIKLDRWLFAKVIGIDDKTDKIKIDYFTFSKKLKEFDNIFDRYSNRIRMEEEESFIRYFSMNKLDGLNMPTIGEFDEYPITFGSSGAGGIVGEYGGHGGGILQIKAKNVIIEKNGGIFCNGGKGIGNAGYGGGGTIYIKCNKLHNKGSIKAVCGQHFGLNHIKIYINIIDFPNELCHIIYTYFSEYLGCGQIIIDSNDSYNNNNIIPKPL